jgi:hypothetical protein
MPLIGLILLMVAGYSSSCLAFWSLRALPTVYWENGPLQAGVLLIAALGFVGGAGYCVWNVIQLMAIM